MLNKVTLIGNLGADPDVRAMPSGGTVATVSLATTRRWKDKQTGERKEATEWHRVVFFNRLAEIVEEYLKKGSQIYVEGRLQTRKWQSEDGTDRYTTEIVGEEMQMLGGKRSESEPEPEQTPRQPRPSSGTHLEASVPKNTIPDYPPYDDDIPF